MHRPAGRIGVLVVLLLVSLQTDLHAQVFEIIEPDIQQGGFELEVLSGVVMSAVEPGEERSAYEVGGSYAPLGFWKTSLAIEVAQVRNDGVSYEAFEWENLFLLPIGQGAGKDDDLGVSGQEEEDFLNFEALALYTSWEIPRQGGVSEGSFVVGPVLGLAIGPVDTIGNLFAEIPFSEDEDAGLAYAVSAAVDLAGSRYGEYAVGLEAHGAFDGLFVDALPFGEQGHFLGPALYSEFDIGGRTLEPRLAFLLGLTKASPDAIASINIEFRF